MTKLQFLKEIGISAFGFVCIAAIIILFTYLSLFEWRANKRHDELVGALNRHTATVERWSFESKAQNRLGAVLRAKEIVDEIEKEITQNK